ncbi:hypothetical protein NLG97_g1178 [Lecanicillium saksenae]|uniref:Uncharacterized protein n=1 Tax=Lecanicillium saksenae TaxID=468837 RepID=A0ACC1R4H4_9HYPO|nr:hypothetical protein NLG97_g1178 [Lecanicillium saksenae]
MADELATTLLEAPVRYPLSETEKTAIDGVSRQDKLIYRLQRARDAGQLTDFHYRSNMKMMFIAGHENVKVLLVSCLFEVAQLPNVQQRLYEEIIASGPEHDEDGLKNLPYLTTVIYETLRLYPPLAQLINRRTIEPITLGNGICIRPGTWVGWNAYGVHTDPKNWGTDALEFNPDRWGNDVQSINNMSRAYQNRGLFIAFNAWSRMCIGVDFALLQMRVTLSVLLRQFSIAKDPNYTLVLNETAALELEDCQLIFTHRDRE